MKLKSKSLMMLLLVSMLGLASCSNKPNTPSVSESESESEIARLQSISFESSEVSVEEEGSVDLRILYNPENISSSQKGLTYHSDNERIAVVDENFGTVTGLEAGVAHITAISKVNSSITATCTVTVTAKDRKIPVESVSLDRESASILKGGYIYVNATVHGTNNRLATDRRLTWQSDHTNVATIDPNTRKITAVDAGVATITATSVDDPTKSASIEVTVVDNHVDVASVSLNKSNLSLQDEDDPLGSLTVTVSGAGDAVPTDTSVTWEALDAEANPSDVIAVYVTSENTASVKALKEGSAFVKVKSNEDNTKFAVCAVTVAAKGARDSSVHVSGISFVEGQQYEVQFGNTLPVATKVTPNNAGDQAISYQLKAGSTLPEGTTFNAETGLITAGNKEGSFVIVATAHDTELGTYSVEGTFNIVDPVTHVSSIQSSITTTTIYSGDTLDFSNGGGIVTVLPSDATNKGLSFLSTNTDAATIDSTGLLTAKSFAANEQATTTITVTSDENPDIFKTIDVTVKGIPVNRVTLDKNSLLLDKSETFTLSAQVFYRHPTKADDESTVGDNSDVNFEVIAGSENVSVNSFGKVTGLAVGNATIKVSSKENPSVYATCAVEVTNKKPLVVQLNLPDTINAYEFATAENNLTAVQDNKGNDNLYKNSNAAKGQFFVSDETKSSMIYKVGDQGEFKFAPVAKARYFDETGAVVGTDTIEEAVIDYKWYIANYDAGWGEYSADPITNTSTYFTQTENGFDFTPEARGHRFKMVVSVEEDNQYNLNEELSTNFELEVVKGYNVYTTEELSYIDNTDLSKITAYAHHLINWSAERAAAGLPTSVEGDLIMHKDITLSSTIIPAERRWTEAEVEKYLATSSGKSDFQTWMNTMGIKDEQEAKNLLYDSPNDYLKVFERETSVDETFSLEGNFFKLDASALGQNMIDETEADKSLMKFQNGDGSHAQIFGFNAHYDHYKKVCEQKGTVNINNLKMVGNGGFEAAVAKANAAKEAGKTDLYNRYLGDVKLAKGGFVGVKSGYTELNVNNSIYASTFTPFIIEIHGSDCEHWADSKTVHVEATTFNIDRTKCYDLYNAAIYLFGTKQNSVTNCWLTGAGGPLFIMDEYNHGDNTIGKAHPTQAMVDIDNTYLYNPVSGTEPWFEGHNAASLMQSYIVNAGNPTITGEGWNGGYAKYAYDTASNGMTKAEIADAIENGLMTEEQLEQLRSNVRTMSNKDKKVNLIAIDMQASNFVGNNYMNLSGRMDIAYGSSSAYMDLAETAKSEAVADSGKWYAQGLVGADFAKIITKSSNGGVLYINGSDQAVIYGGNSNLASYVSGDYMAYYLDIGYATGSAPSQYGGFIGLMLGTFSYYDNWAI